MCGRSDRTYVEDLKDPDEVQPPSGNHIFIVLRVEQSRHHISFALLNDLPLNPRHGSIARTPISGLYCIHVIIKAHVVNCLTASHTG